MNMQISTQLIPPSDPLVAKMPSGRDIHSTKLFAAPVLGEESLTQMRAPPDADEMDGDDNSSDDDDDEVQNSVPGTFLGSSSAASTGTSYY